jgi:hypothetical protein
VVTMDNTVFWNVMPCHLLLDKYLSVKLHSVTSKNTAMVIGFDFVSLAPNGSPTNINYISGHTFV